MTAMAVSPDGRTALVAGADPLHPALGPRDRTASSRPIATRQGQSHRVAFSQDGKTVLTGSQDGTARLWDAATGQPRGAPLVHPDEVVAVAFHPDGGRIFTASRDTGVHVWDARTGQPVGRPMPLLQSLSSMTLGPDGRTILLGSQLGMAQLFDLDTALPLGNAFSHERNIMAVALSRDGRIAMTCGQDASARLWHMPAPIAGDLERIRLWSQVITGLELKGDGLVSVLDEPAWQDRRQRLQLLGGAPVPKGFDRFGRLKKQNSILNRSGFFVIPV